MKLLVVTAFCKKDAHLAKAMYEWIGKIGGIRDNDVLLVVDDGYNDDSFQGVFNAAKQVSNSVMVCHCGQPTKNEKWPVGPNRAFGAASKHIYDSQKGPFLWLEPDCVPTRDGWLGELEEEYAKCGKSYLGGIIPCRPPLPRQVFIGIAVYPQTVYAVFKRTAARTPNMAFDVAMSNAIVKDAHPTKLMQLVNWKPGQAPEVKSASQINQRAALFHKDKSGNAFKLISGLSFSKSTSAVIKKSGEQYFVHSGDLGDIVYSLPTVKALGGGHMVLIPDEKSPPWHKRFTRESMTEKRASVIKPLLESQPYIKSCLFSGEMVEGAINLNEFRELFGELQYGRYLPFNLSAMHLEWFGLPHWLETEQWLFVDPVAPPKPVIFSRSERYHDNRFDWKAIYDKYGKEAVFCGTQEEHKQFCDEVGAVEWLRTNNLLELAKYISGCELYIGNQSVGYSIAEGLKKRAILEWIPGPASNCHFNRKELYYGTGRYQLPDIKPTMKRKINWCAINDLHSGLGRSAYQIARHFKTLDVRWVPTRTCGPFTEPQSEFEVFSDRDNVPSVVYDAVPELHRFAKRGDIVFSMWESTRLPANAVNILNRAKACIVPSEWGANCYRDSGVTVPIYKVPLGTDISVYNPVGRSENEVFRVGYACRFCWNRNPRKNVDTMLRAFYKAFKDKGDVALDIKGYDQGWPESADPRVRIIKEFWKDDVQMADWYRSLGAFVNIASGGGWEMHLHEAMCCGAVPISLHFSGCTEFFNRDCGFVVSHKLVKPTWDVYCGCGEWADPSEDSLASALIDAYNNRDSNDKRDIAVESASRFTWERSASEMERVINEQIDS